MRSCFTKFGSSEGESMGYSKLEHLTDFSKRQIKFFLENLTFCMSGVDQQDSFLESTIDYCLTTSLASTPPANHNYSKALFLFANFLAVQNNIMPNNMELV